ncbi:MAG: ACT domain-containing protein, partial [Oscillospiraceae bacterium]|nr:ACT domain-containing protein [Oscillospiraceae bacterium]
MRAIVTVVGQDRVGIIADVCSLLANNKVNVLDISQTVLQEYFTMIMLVDTAGAEMPFAQLVKYLHEEGEKIGLSIHV